jgi:WD40 repeat protein/transcriptional regulator with XRE-family HTH domain
MADSTRLQILVDLRKAAHLTQRKVAQLFDMEGSQGRQTIGNWEAGIHPPSKSRRTRFIHYLWDELGLRRTPRQFEEVWAILVQEWKWYPISDEEWQSFTTIPRPGREQLPSTWPKTDPPSSAVSRPQVDWGEAPDVSDFRGRETEVAQLSRWMVDDGCRLVAVLGMGGLGKTALATWTATQVKDTFAAVVWRSLRNAPPLDELLAQCLSVLSHDAAQELSPDVDKRLKMLQHYLHRQRCLIVLDNFETVLSADRAGYYLPGYEGYGQLLQQVGEGRHQSCLLITSREKPKELSKWADETSPVRKLRLRSMIPADGRVLLQGSDLSGSEEQWRNLHERYSGNPLALKIVADTIRELFAGKIDAFLDQEAIIFTGIRDLLDEQLRRLSPLEQEVMVSLATAREPVDLNQLRSDIMQPTSAVEAIEALHALQRRSLLEQTETGFTLQNVVLEYVTEYIIAHSVQEVLTATPMLLQRHALVQAQANAYVRESQQRLILQPLAERLLATMDKAGVEAHLRQILSTLRQSQLHRRSYVGGNILNLLVRLDSDLRGWDFSHLAVWQADLRGVDAPEVDFRQADLARSSFTDTFDNIYSLAFSPDGECLAAGTLNSEIRIWRVRDRQPLLSCVGHTGALRSVCFSPDGALLASGSVEQTVRLWGSRSGRCLQVLTGHTREIRSVAFSPHGELVASGSGDETIKIWEVQSGRCIHTLRGGCGWVRSVCFSPDGTLLASGGDDQVVRLWDIQSGRCLQMLTGHTRDIRSVTFNPDGTLLASGGDGQTVRVWDRASGRCLHTLQGHTRDIRSVCFSPDGELVASGAYDQTVRLWDRNSGHCLYTLHGHLGGVRSVCFYPDSRMLASGGDDQTIRVWDRSSGRCLHTLQGHTRWIWSISFSHDGMLLASGGGDQAVRLWDGQSGNYLAMLQGHTNGVTAVHFSPDGKLLASGSDDQTVRLWDSHSGRCLHILQGHTSGITSVGFSPDGKLLASGSDDRMVRLWDSQTGQSATTLQGHTNGIMSVCFHPNGHRLASGSSDQTIQLWEVSSGRCLATLHGHTSGVRSICFSPDGNRLASGSADGTIKLWDLHSGHCLTTLQGHNGRIRSVCFSPDGRLLASGGSDQTVRLWDSQTSQCLIILCGHTSVVMSVCFHPNGQILASGSTDETIKFWDVQTGMSLRSLSAERPYERMNITEVTGLTPTQIVTLKALGAVESTNQRSLLS